VFIKLYKFYICFNDISLYFLDESGNWLAVKGDSTTFFIHPELSE
jgi:hypothetical protein